MRFQLRNVFVLIVFFVTAPLVWMVLFSDSDLTETAYLEQRVAELRDRLHYAESVNQERENDVHILRNQIKELVKADCRGNGSTNHNAALEDARNLLANLSSEHITLDITPPGIFNYLPHLVGRPGALKPGFKLSRGRVGVSIVMGIPTVKRDRKNYLMYTLDSLLANLDEEDRKETLIVVFIAEPYDKNYVRTLAKEVDERFEEHLKSGLIEVVAPPSDFYPNLDDLQQTFNDTMERVKWRTKQNLDYSFLMMYAKQRGTYYLQLEDDITAKPGYLRTVKGFVANQKTDDWMLLEFSYVGFIGKLFKSQDLPMVVEFILMFYRDKPCDWLLGHLFYVKICSPDQNMKECGRSVKKVRRLFRPSLFQHIGIFSSLPNKTQYGKDTYYRAPSLVLSPINPDAEVSTSIKVYKEHGLERAYMGDSYFWGTYPKEGDHISFKFQPPISIESYIFRSGSPDHSDDKLFDTAVEVLPVSGIHVNDRPDGIAGADDRFLLVNNFDQQTGLASGTIDRKLGLIDTLRLRVLQKSRVWVVISEIKITPRIS